MTTKDLSLSIRTAQVLGLTGTAFLAGKTFSQSFSTVPAFLLAPAPVLARQWKRMFDSDKLLAPVVAVSSGTIFALLAHREPSLSNPRATFYALASALLFSTLPYAQLLLHPLNNKLEAQAALQASSGIADTDAESNTKREETVHYLVDQWATANIGRSLIVALAAFFATHARCID